jgi:hypothetical protein
MTPKGFFVKILYLFIFFLASQPSQHVSSPFANSQVKVKPVRAMKASGGVELYLHSFLTLALDGTISQLHTLLLYP